jgi:hypothetical protein
MDADLSHDLTSRMPIVPHKLLASNVAAASSPPSMGATRNSAATNAGRW